MKLSRGLKIITGSSVDFIQLWKKEHFTNVSGPISFLLCFINNKQQQS